MKLLQTLIVLAALAFLGYAIWQNVSSAKTEPPAPSGGDKTAAPGRSSGGGVSATRPGIRPQPSACAVCGGAGFVSCAVCGGKGTIARVEQVKCDQCKGTGRYKTRIGAGEAPCPFCKGTGRIEKTVTVRCSACGGTGQTPCPACGAAGR